MDPQKLTGSNALYTCAGGLKSPYDAAFDASFVQPYNAKSLQLPWCDIFPTSKHLWINSPHLVSSKAMFWLIAPLSL